MSIFKAFHTFRNHMELISSIKSQRTLVGFSHLTFFCMLGKMANSDFYLIVFLPVFHINLISHSSQLWYLFFESAEPFFAKFWSSTDSFVPDYWKICFGSEILCNGDSIVQIEYNMPVTARDKHSFSGILNQFNLNQKKIN